MTITHEQIFDDNDNDDGNNDVNDDENSHDWATPITMTTTSIIIIFPKNTI